MCFRYNVTENLREKCYFNPSPPSTLPLLDGVTPIFKVLIYEKKKKSAHFHLFPNWCFWFVCHTNVVTFVCHADFDGHVHDTRFCDFKHRVDTWTLPFCIFTCGSMLMFLSNRDKRLTFWLILLSPLPRIVFRHAKFDGANIRFQILCLWTCSWHFLSDLFHVFPSWCLWEIVIIISLFEFFLRS